MYVGSVAGDSTTTFMGCGREPGARGTVLDRRYTVLDRHRAGALRAPSGCQQRAWDVKKQTHVPCKRYLITHLGDSYPTLDASVHVAYVLMRPCAGLSHWTRTSRLLKHMRLLLVRFTLLMVHIF